MMEWEMYHSSNLLWVRTTGEVICSYTEHFMSDNFLWVLLKSHLPNLSEEKIISGSPYALSY